MKHITLGIDPGTPPDPDLRLLEFTNDDAMIAGAELSGQIELSPAWTLAGQASYIDGRNIDRREALPSIFPLNGRVSLLWHDAVQDAYGVEFIAWFVDNQDRVATTLFESPTPGFTKLDLRGYWQATESCRFTAGLENLGDRNYLEHLSVHNPQVFEPGINFYLATRIDY